MSHYFDANATTPLLPEARAAWLEAMDEHWQNPSSPSRASARVHAKLEGARASIADLFQVPRESLVFNSGATEGNRDVLAYMRKVSPRKRLAMSAVEHPSILENARAIWGEDACELPVDGNGVIRIDALERGLAKGDIALVSLMAANNETGVIQPWPEVIEICRRQRVALHIDATQWVGKEPLDGLSRADFITASGHKFGGPKGVGIVIAASSFSGFQGQRGGGQEHDHRAGTENYPGVASMLAALQASYTSLEAARVRVRGSRDAFEVALLAKEPEVKIWSSGAPRLVNTFSLCLPIGDNLRFVRRLDQRGFQVSTGSACATGKAGPSHVLGAMGVAEEFARRTVRISSLMNEKAETWAALAHASLSAIEEIRNEGTNPQVISI
ncbi:cysteine desulfurase family protein [Cerasicoccus frondis]|uniref:cysteine desulfurase family protein n=1 Tax=Cerasicoccus frondis TaxID=490090 RepID=UPI002852A32E|nr:aminotransferase class V-fold PLP-dependent enzyme [Cerasicoccus frondis]